MARYPRGVRNDRLECDCGAPVVKRAEGYVCVGCGATVADEGEGKRPDPTA
jgi:hypothetical protein